MGRLYGGIVMVMTSDMWHILFEPAREDEWMYVLNEERPTERNKRKMRKVTNEISRKENVDIVAVS